MDLSRQEKRAVYMKSPHGGSSLKAPQVSNGCYKLTAQLRPGPSVKFTLSWSYSLAVYLLPDKNVNVYSARVY